MAEDTPYSFRPGGSDVDGDRLTYTIANNPVWLSIDANTGVVSGTPTNADVGSTENIVISVTDNIIATPVLLAAFSLEVTNTNGAQTGVTSVTVPAADLYAIGDQLDFTVNFSEPITLINAASASSPASSLAITLGSATVQANYETSTNTSITYRYTVVVDDLDSDGIEVGELSLNGDTLVDAANNPAIITLSNVGDTADVCR